MNIAVNQIYKGIFGNSDTNYFSTGSTPSSLWTTYAAVFADVSGNAPTIIPDSSSSIGTKASFQIGISATNLYFLNRTVNMVCNVPIIADDLTNYGINTIDLQGSGLTIGQQRDALDSAKVYEGYIGTETEKLPLRYAAEILYKPIGIPASETK